MCEVKNNRINKHHRELVSMDDTTLDDAIFVLQQKLGKTIQKEMLDEEKEDSTCR